MPAVVGDGVQVIRRFSGGGTVYVDRGTVFASLICSAAALPPEVPLFPRPLMQWTERVYTPLFRHVSPPFALREHDYALGDKKFGGNAQSITKDRFLHHTSFLWDFDPANMAYLKLPPKAPAYREGREHGSFICRLKDHFPSSRDHFVGRSFLGTLEENFRVVGFSQLALEGELRSLEARRKRPPQTRVLGAEELLRALAEGR